MLTKLYSVRNSAWFILFTLAVLTSVSALSRSTGLISTQAFTYVLQPAAALIIALISYLAAKNRRPVARRTNGRAFLVGSIVAIWGVIYFLSGLISTYVHNSLFTDARGIALNLWQFGVVAAAIEYSRFSLIKLVNRRDMLWFGFIISCVLAFQQMNFAQLQQAQSLTDIIQLVFSDFIPSIFSSFTLTYLAITSGLAAMLVYRLGLVAIFVLLPILPDLDWYLQGISLMLLAVIIYLILDRNNRADVQHPHRRRDKKLTLEILWFTGIASLVCFMIGVFSYRPYAISSNSMAPTYSRGSMVVVQKVGNPVDIKIGDIVQYKARDKMVTHRVQAINASSDGSGNRVYILKGDNNPTTDEPVAQDRVIGVVRTNVPFIGYPSVWLMELSEGGR